MRGQAKREFFSDPRTPAAAKYEVDTDSDNEPLFGAHTPTHRAPRWTEGRWVVAVCLCTILAGNYALLSVLVGAAGSDQLPSEFGIESIEQGLVMGTEELVSIVGILLTTRLWRRTSHHRILLVTCCGTWVCVWLLCTATDKASFVALRFVHALNSAVVELCGLCMAVATFDLRLQGVVFGVFHLSCMGGLVGGVPLAQWVYDKAEDEGFYACTITLGIGITAATLVLQNNPSKRVKSATRLGKNLRRMSGDGRLVASAMFVFMAWAAFSVWTSVLPWHFHHHHTREADDIMKMHFLSSGVMAAVVGALYTNGLLATTTPRFALMCVVGFVGVLSSMGLFHAHLTLRADYVCGIAGGLGMGAFVPSIKLLLSAIASSFPPNSNLTQHIFVPYLVMESAGVLVGRLGGYSSVALYGYSWGQLYAMVALLFLCVVCLCLLKEHFDGVALQRLRQERRANAVS